MTKHEGAAAWPVAAWFVGLAVLFGLGVFGESLAQRAVQASLVGVGGWLCVTVLARLIIRLARRQ